MEIGLFRRTLFLALLLHSGLAVSETTKSKTRPLIVAVIDTGYDFSLKESKFLCSIGHRDFTDTSLADNHGHGTHIATTIHQFASNVHLNSDSSVSDEYRLLSTRVPNYCQVIIKYYDPSSKKSSLLSEIEAFEYAIKLKVDVINYSSAGQHPSTLESIVVKKALDAGIKVVVAAGNAATNIDIEPYYPAAIDPRLYVVGNLDSKNIRSPTSNYGSIVNIWERGVDVYSVLPTGKLGKMSGTSQATAATTGKLIKQMLKSRAK